MVFVAWPVWAADGVAVRLNDQGERVRVVLAWPGRDVPPHTIQKIDETTIEIRLDMPGTLAAPFTPNPQIPEIRDIRRVSDEGQGLRLWVLMSRALYQRDVVAGNRLMLDFTKDAAARAAAPAVTTTPPPTPATPAPPVDILAEQQAADMKAKAEANPLTLDPKTPTVITLSSINKFGMAAFTTPGVLWLVVDDPNFLGSPDIKGSGARALSSISRLTTKDATVFKIKTPDGPITMRGEGGDILWRVVLAPPDDSQKPIVPDREVDKNGGSVSWPLTSFSKIIPIMDDDTGQAYQVVTVGKSHDFTGPARQFVEFSTLPSSIGMAVVPLVDDVTVTTGDRTVLIGRSDGLSITSALQAATHTPRLTTLPETTPDRTVQVQDLSTVPLVPVDASAPGPNDPLFRFKRWAMGGQDALLNNEIALASDLAVLKPEDRAGGFMNIGKMYLANGRGAEAMGYFRLALDVQESLNEQPEFRALRGAARAMNGQFDLAYEDLRDPALDRFPDIDAWRSYVLANLQDWQQAGQKLSANFTWVQDYPATIAAPMLLSLAETALRAGQVSQAQKILDTVSPPPPSDSKTSKKKMASNMDLATMMRQSQANYLRGEAARQMGDKDKAREIWTGLLDSSDDRARVRARLALTVLDHEDGKITLTQTIDQLEGLRFAWRGDDLEVTIASRLGETYLRQGEYVRGLNVLRDAASLDPDSEQGKNLTAAMRNHFRNLFTAETMKKVDPIDAITIYERFGELMPAGPASTPLTMALIDRLMQVDLLDRAAKILGDLVNHKLQDDERVRAVLRLAAIYLLDRRPDQALQALNRAEGMIATLTDSSLADARRQEQQVLKGRALFQAGRPDQALSLLSTMPASGDALRAVADIAWQTGRWNDAAKAIEMLLDQNPVAANQPPTREQAELIRNLAVATNLSGDRAHLATLRDRYGVTMQQSDLVQEFDVVTRARQTPTLADRDSLNKVVSEVEMFSGFLNAYRQSGDPAPAVNPASVEPPTSPTPETVTAD